MRPWALVVAMTLVAGCEGPEGGFSSDSLDDGAGRQLRSIVAEQGELACEAAEGYFACEDPATGARYDCKCVNPGKCLEPQNPPESWYCREVVRPAPECDSARRKGDGLGGRGCWAPPHDVCAGGAGQGETWFCLPDGSRCCKSSDTCYLCGWVEMMDCLDNASGMNLDPAVCDAIRSRLPPGLAACMDKDGADEACDPGLQDPACEQPDTYSVVCP